MTRRDETSLIRRVFRLPESSARARRALDDELRFHLDGRIEELVAQGLPRHEAETEARRRFGDLDAYRTAALVIDNQIIQEHRRMDVLDTITRELRHAARSLGRSRGFTIAAVITLGLGIGAATAIFTMLDAVVLRPLAYPNADRLVELTSPVPKFKGDTLWGLARHEAFYFQDNSRAIADIGVYQNAEVTVGGDGGDHPAERARAAQASAGLFRVLGITPAYGRNIVLDDNRAQVPTALVLGHGYWQRRFGGDPSVVGRTIDIDGYPMTVVGILPASAQLPDLQVDVWYPANTYPEQPAYNNHTWNAIARLRPGFTAADAQRELAPLTARLPELFPDAEPPNFVKNTGFYTQVRPLRDVVVGEVMTRALWILFGSVLVVLFIAVANLSSLFLVRVDARRRETAVRAALGADRSHLAAQLLAESILIALAAGALGVALAQLGLRVMLTVAPTSLPRLSEVHLGAPGIAFAAGGALVVALVLGLLPLLGSSLLDLALLRDGARGSTVSRRRHVVRGALVVSQVALSLVLITAAGLMVRSFRNLRSVQPGFTPDGVLAMTLAVPGQRYGRDYAKTSAFYEQVISRVEQLPGVVVAGVSEKVPLKDGNLCTGVNIEVPDTERAIGDCPSTALVSPGYFEAMGIRIAGDPLTWSGMNQHDGRLIVSGAFADLHHWTGRDAVGKGMNFMGTKPPWYRVSGVAADVLADGFDKPPVSIVYFPMLPIPGGRLWGVPTEMNLVVRTKSGNAMALVPAITRIVSELEPAAATANATLMNTLVAKSMARRTFTMMLLGIAAAMALLLSVVGLYGVLSYVVGQRRGEIAIRMALGAQVAQVGRMVVGQSLRLAALGVAIGVVAALASMHVLQSLLFGVKPTDPLLLVLASLLLLVVAAAAGWLPARRAASIDPADALRAE
jgi:putative ABC transport system permease protein